MKIHPMQPHQDDPSPGPDVRPGRPAVFPARHACLWLLALAVVAGCSGISRQAATLARQAAEIGCISQCQAVKDDCDDDARFTYRQCQAGYQTAQRDFRWCNAKGTEPCGYPWWSCSENLFGYCANRYWECHAGCRRTAGG